MAEINVQATWLLDDTNVPVAANQTLVQVGNGAAYLTFGHINPPIVDGPPGAELTQDMVKDKVFPVVPVARVQVSIPLLEELRDKITNVLKLIEASK